MIILETCLTCTCLTFQKKNISLTHWKVVLLMTQELVNPRFNPSSSVFD
jgi:hypothetical protein